LLFSEKNNIVALSKIIVKLLKKIVLKIFVKNKKKNIKQNLEFCLIVSKFVLNKPKQTYDSSRIRLPA
jgi:hypothetical protein